MPPADRAGCTDGTGQGATMIRLAELLAALETAADPAALLAKHLQGLDDAEAAVTLGLLAGQRPRRAVAPADLRRAACAAEAIPDWLLEASLAAAGSTAEAIANLLPWPDPPSGLSLTGYLAALPGADAAAILAQLAPLPPDARVPAIRLATGTFRTTLPAPVLARAVAKATGADAATIALRLAAGWIAAAGLAALTQPAGAAHAPCRFVPLARFLEPTGHACDWLALPRPAGPRLQLIRRPGAAHLWAEDGRLMTPDRPQLATLVQRLPEGTVIEAVEDRPGQLRALDLLEWRGQPLADHAFSDRRECLAQLIQAGIPWPDAPDSAGRALTLAPPLMAPDWQALHRHRAAGGLWLRRHDAGLAEAWHDWPPPPRTTDAVLVHAELAPGGQGLAALTFAVRAGNTLVPVARTTQGLTAAENAALASWIRAAAIARFGPVREVPPQRLYRLSYAAVDPAPRRKAGLWLRDVRILCALPDHTPDQIAALDSLTTAGT